MRKLVLLALALAVLACERDPPHARLDVVAAASLGPVLAQFAAAFEQANPGTDVRVRTGASTLMARQVGELGISADVLMLADEKLFSEILEPHWCRDHVRFLSERIVIGYTDHSRAAGEISAENWTEVLLREGVRVGMADPGKAPVGYRTRMVLQLAEIGMPGSDFEKRVLSRVGERNRRADVAELIAPLQAGALDYAFLYGTTAASAGLRILELPEKINLGSRDFAQHYGKASVEVAGRSPGETLVRTGRPIVYGASLNGASKARDQAAEFLAYVLSGKGRAIFAEQGFEPLEMDMRTDPAALLKRLSVTAR